MDFGIIGTVALIAGIILLLNRENERIQTIGVICLFLFLAIAIWNFLYATVPAWGMFWKR